MTRETKVGLMMVALLVGVFGFLLYKRVHQPLEGLANQDVRDVSTTDRDRATTRGDVIPELDESDSFSLEQPRSRKSERPKQITKSEDEFAQKLPADEEDFAEPVSVRPQLKPPATSNTDDTDFDQFVERSQAKKGTQHEPTLEPSDNAFDEPVRDKQKSSRQVVQVAATTESETLGGDEPEAESEPEPLETPFEDAEATSQSLSVPAPIDDEEETDASPFDSTDRSVPINSKDSRQMESIPATKSATGRDSTGNRSRQIGQPVLVQQTSEFDNELVPAPREERRAAPITFEERSFSPEGTPRASVSGSSYVIEPSDNFWAISRKRYGVGRYYMALARHNEQVIPDPKRMKPGVTISTPDVALLEQRYAELIPKPAPADPAPSVVTTQSRKTENVGPKGFFVSTDGAPMYRITDQDTLSDIAKSHLGRSSRWVQILEMNRNVLRDGNELKIGTVLRLPADASQVQVVGNPREIR